MKTRGLLNTSKLEEASSVDITNLDDLKLALRKRMEFFNEHGCRLSDHAMDPVYFEECDDEKLTRRSRKHWLEKVLQGMKLKDTRQTLFFPWQEYARLNGQCSFILA